MPYIKQAKRDELQAAIVDLLDALELSTPGDLNFVISSLIWSKWMDDPSYTKGNELMGVLECAKLEFYRRRLAAYENRAITANGDLEV